MEPRLGPFDWRDDPMGTIIAVPEVRARFMRFEPGKGPGAGSHSHEESGGVEVFVVLEGKMAFEIEGETVTATAGQAVVAYPHQQHRAGCAGDEPWWMRRMASARSGAIESTVMWGSRFASGMATVLVVTISSTSGWLRSRSMACPVNRPWVQAMAMRPTRRSRGRRSSSISVPP